MFYRTNKNVKCRVSIKTPCINRANKLQTNVLRGQFFIENNFYDPSSDVYESPCRI